MTSLTRWTWVWVNSGSWWWTGRPGVLQFMGSWRVGHDWVTELNWTELLSLNTSSLSLSCSLLIVPHGGVFQDAIVSFMFLRSNIPRWRRGKESAYQGTRHRRHRSRPLVRKIFWSRKRQPTPVLLLGKAHEQRSGGLQSMGSQSQTCLSDWARAHTDAPPGSQHRK